MRRGTSTDVTSTKPRVDVPDVWVAVWLWGMLYVCGDLHDSNKVFGSHLG